MHRSEGVFLHDTDRNQKNSLVTRCFLARKITNQLYHKAFLMFRYANDKSANPNDKSVKLTYYCIHLSSSMCSSSFAFSASFKVPVSKAPSDGDSSYRARELPNTQTITINAISMLAHMLRGCYYLR